MSVDNGRQPANIFREARACMVAEQLERRKIKDKRVLHAMGTVPREEFVDEGLRKEAYDDNPLPIACGQTISQPFTVAFQCEALQLKPEDKVLEIGTGSGYCAAVLSLLSKEVYSVERIPELAAESAALLVRLKFSNVHVIAGDGTIGLPREAPFDAILVTAGGCSLPEPFVEQLAPGGRIVIPLGRTTSGQSMWRFTKLPDELKSENLGGFSFVPLIGEHGWDETGACE